ncbi:MAG: hypothetical protein SangKO_015380 [Sandaracinaceae bacterium]
MSYRSPLEAARARISALEDLLDSQDRVVTGEGDDAGGNALREVRALLAEERAEHEGRLADLRNEREALDAKLAGLETQLVEERARRQAEVSLLRTKLEEAERAITHNASLFEAEQTMQRAQAEAERARLEQKLVQRDTQLRELREEIRVHLSGDRREIRAHYEARVRTVGTELAEQGSLSRRLEQSLEEAKAAVDSLPPADERDREGMVEREMARRKLAIGQVELERTRARIERLELELERITAAEAQLAAR